MATQANAVNFSGVSPFVVSTNPAVGSFTTVQEAVDAATLVGGGTVYIDAGTYNEVITITAAVSLIALGSGAGSGGTNVTLNNGVLFSTATQNIDAEVYGINFNGAAGVPGFATSGANTTRLVATNCNFQGSSDTCMDFATTGTFRAVNCNINASTGVKTFNVTAGSVNIYNSQVNSTDTQATVNATNQTLFFFDCVVFDSYDVTDGQVIFFGSLPGTISTLPIATVRTAGAVGFPGSLIINDASATGYIVDGNGVGTSGAVFFFSFAQAPQVTTPISFDPNLTILSLNELPYGAAGGTATAVRGSAAFDSGDFTVSDGFVELLGTSPMQRGIATVSQTLENDHGYYVTSGALNLALPTTATVGSVIAVSLAGGTSWSIVPATVQSIRYGGTVTSGTISTTGQGDSITFECYNANTDWITTSSMGNLNF